MIYPRPEWWQVVEATERWEAERQAALADKEEDLRGQEQG